MQGGFSLAYKIDPKWSVGITANLLYSMMEFEMPMSMPPSMLKGVIDPSTGFTFGDMFSAPPSSGGLGYSEVVASANMKSLASYEFNGKIGIAFKPSEKFSAGINYTLPVNLNYKNGTAAMDMTAQMNDVFGKVVAGIMYQNPGYTEAQAQAAAMAKFNALGIDLTKGATDQYQAQATLGLPQSLSVGFSVAASKKLRLSMDAVLIKAGAEYAVNKKLTFRCGYAYGSNPVPAATVFPVFPAVVKHHLSLGGTVSLSSALKLNAAYEHAFRNDETASSESMVGAQFNNSTSGLANNIYHISISWFMKK
jgi:long-chain fatty acid transport protein